MKRHLNYIFSVFFLVLVFATSAQTKAQDIANPILNNTPTVTQNKQLLNYRPYFTNAEIKQMCEKCDKSMNRGQINDDCTMCVGFVRGVLASVDETNILRQKIDSKTVQICYKTEPIGQIIYKYVTDMTTSRVQIDGSSYKSFVEFLARNYACEPTISNTPALKDDFINNIETRIEKTIQ